MIIKQSLKLLNAFRFGLHDHPTMMFASRQIYKISRPIVVFDTIKMMNHVTFGQGRAVSFFPDKDMLKNITIFNRSMMCGIPYIDISIDFVTTTFPHGVIRSSQFKKALSTKPALVYSPDCGSAFYALSIRFMQLHLMTFSTGFATIIAKFSTQYTGMPMQLSPCLYFNYIPSVFFVAVFTNPTSVVARIATHSARMLPCLMVKFLLIQLFSIRQRHTAIVS